MSIIEEVQKQFNKDNKKGPSLGSWAHQYKKERDMIAIRLAHVKDLIYALGLDYNKLSDKGKDHYDSLVKSVSEYGEGK